MRTRRRRFFEGEPQHIYQRTIGGFNIFYDLEDYIVFYTVFSTSVLKFNVNVLKLCLMIDHVHILLEVDNKKEMSDFICYYTSVFVKEMNRASGRKGALFEKAYGNAPKKGEKKIRSAIAYLFNNPVEKKLCKRAECYRWNFLAYAVSLQPFSEYRKKKDMSKWLHTAMKEVDLSFSNGWYIKYAQIRRMFKKLNDAEKEILTDFIITTYSPFDYQKLISYFGTYEDMVLAVNSFTGSEYDVRETYYQHSDRAYQELADYMKEVEGFERVRAVTVLPTEAKIVLAERLQSNTSASSLQIRKFLHI